MTTTLTPPSQPAPPSPERPAAPGSRVVSTIAIILGAVVVLGALAWGVVSAVRGANTVTSAKTTAVTGVEDLDVDISAGTLRVEFADIDSAELEATAVFGAERWTLERDGETLRVESPRTPFGLGWIFGGAGDAVLRLPAELEGIDADLAMSAGELRASGEWGDISVDVSAGRADIEGSAQDAAVEVSAGRADVDLTGVREGDFSVSAGDLVGSLSGQAPRELSLDVSAGSLVLAVPVGEYDVRSDVSAGEFDNRVGSTPGATNVVTVSVSAGSATLRAD